MALIRESDVDILDGEARTPLIHAARYGKMEIVSYVLSARANINHQDRNGSSALHFAVQERHLKIVEYLLAQGAAVDAKEEHGNTPL